MQKALGMVMKLLGLKKLSTRMVVTGADRGSDGGDTKQVDRS